MSAGGHPLLEVEGLVVSYGASPALKGVSLRVLRGELVALLGANGAGKSTTLAAVMGWLRPSAGTIRLDGEPITALRTQDRVRRGLAICPEGRQVFGRLTVEENLRLGAYLHADSRAVASDLQRVLELFPRLGERLRQRAGSLSGGEQTMLSIGRALMSRPRLLLLDEPSLGLAPLLVERIFEQLDVIRRQGTTVLLVEQNAWQALELADRAYVLEGGRVALSGRPDELMRDEAVRSAYLGG